jgi:hypothetical protein
MAKKGYSRMKKFQPAVETLTFDLGNVSKGSAGPGIVPGKATYFIDLSQCASLANRRFYRQGITWAVAGMKLNSTMVVENTVAPTGASPSGAAYVQKLPNTWVMSNAWEKGFRAWQRMNNEALSETPSVKPKFLDFKIYMDTLHHSTDQGYGRNLLPATLGIPQAAIGNFTDATAGEWESSKLRIPDAISEATREREIIAVGASFPGNGASGLNAVSLIEGYAASRGLPDILDPNTPDDAADVDGIAPENWIAALFNEGTEQTSDVIEDMISENNQAPYPFENDGTATDTMYPGGANQLSGLQLVAIENITGSTVGGVTYIRGSSFPCGLIRIDLQNNDDTFEMNNILQINLVPGTHRGYLCEPMTDM